MLTPFQTLLREILAQAPSDLKKPDLLAFVKRVNARVQKWWEQHVDEGLWEQIEKAMRGEPEETPVLYAVQTKEGWIYRAPERMTEPNYSQVIARANQTLVRHRDKTALIRDDIQEQFGRAPVLFLVGIALDPETGDIVRVQPVHRDMLPGLFPDAENEDDDA